MVGKSLQELYDFNEPLTADNWEEMSSRIEKAHEDSEYHMEILHKKCHYEKIILDTYWQPGSDNGRPEIFTPTFRLDPFLWI